MYEVYLITNQINGRQYVGITMRGYVKRFQEHIRYATSSDRHALLYDDMRKFGTESFTVTLLEDNISDSEAELKESYYIKKYNTYYLSDGGGYNMTLGGHGMSGYVPTDECLSKRSHSMEGHKFNQIRNEKIRQAMVGREYKQEWREALSRARTGRFTGEDNPFFGKHHTQAAKSKIRNSKTKHRVLQLDPKTNEILQTFSCAAEAGEWVVLNEYSTAQPQTCAGRIYLICKQGNLDCTAYTFKWKFQEKSID